MDSYSKYSTLLTASALAGFGQGLFLYLFLAVLALGGIPHFVDDAAGAASQATSLTSVLALLVAPIAWIVSRIYKKPFQDSVAAALAERALLQAVVIGFAIGVVAGLAGFRLPAT